MSSLVDVLKRDQTDAEIIGYALDTLFNVMNTNPLGEDDEEDEENGDVVEDKKRDEYDESLGLQVIKTAYSARVYVRLSVSGCACVCVCVLIRIQTLTSYLIL